MITASLYEIWERIVGDTGPYTPRREFVRYSQTAIARPRPTSSPYVFLYISEKMWYNGNHRKKDVYEYSLCR